MKNAVKKLFAFLLVLIMVFDSAPIAVLAEGNDTPADVTTQYTGEVSPSDDDGTASNEGDKIPDTISEGKQTGITAIEEIEETDTTENAAEEKTGGTLLYQLNGQTATVIGLSSAVSGDNPASITIPSSFTYNGSDYPVTAIQAEAFKESTKLGSVVFEGSITVGESAFAGSSVTSVEFRGKDTVINKEAFAESEYLTSVTVNYSSAENDGNVIIGESAFDRCTALASFTSTSGVSEIGLRAFAEDKALSTFSIGSNKITTIGEHAFAYATLLNGTLNFPGGVQSIGEYAFFNTAVTGISAPSIGSIGTSVLDNKLLNIELNVGDTYAASEFTGWENKNGFQSLTINANSIKFGANAFGNNKGLKTLTINGTSLVELTDNLFAGTIDSELKVNINAQTVIMKDGALPESENIAFGESTVIRDYRQEGKKQFLLSKLLQAMKNSGITAPEVDVTKVTAVAFGPDEPATTVKTVSGKIICNRTENTTVGDEAGDQDYLLTRDSSFTTRTEMILTMEDGTKVDINKVYRYTATSPSFTLSEMMTGAGFTTDQEVTRIYTYYQTEDGYDKNQYMTLNGNKLTIIKNFPNGKIKLVIYSGDDLIESFVITQGEGAIIEEAQPLVYNIGGKESVKLSEVLSAVGKSDCFDEYGYYYASYYYVYAYVYDSIGTEKKCIYQNGYYYNGTSYDLTITDLNEIAYQTNGYIELWQEKADGAWVKHQFTINLYQDIEPKQPLVIGDFVFKENDDGTLAIKSLVEDYNGDGNIVIPDKLTYDDGEGESDHYIVAIDTSAFDGSALYGNPTLNGKIKTVTFNNTKPLSVGSYAFYGCENLTSISGTGPIASIGSEAFRPLPSLKTVNITGSNISIGSNCFKGNNGLESFTLNGTVSYLSSYCFADCTSLKDVVISGQIDTVPAYTFRGCSNLENLTITPSGSSLAVLPFAFDGCTKLNTSVTYTQQIYTDTTYTNYITIDASEAGAPLGAQAVFTDVSDDASAVSENAKVSVQEQANDSLGANRKTKYVRLSLVSPSGMACTNAEATVSAYRYPGITFDGLIDGAKTKVYQIKGDEAEAEYVKLQVIVNENKITAETLVSATQGIYAIAYQAEPENDDNNIFIYRNWCRSFYIFHHSLTAVCV
mgnify:CR=1 FL=1